LRRAWRDGLADGRNRSGADNKLLAYFTLASNACD